MHAPVAPVGAAVHGVLEVGEGGAVADEGGRAVGRRLRGGVAVQVAPQAARVVAQAVGARVGRDVGQAGEDGAQVDGHA